MSSGKSMSSSDVESIFVVSVAANSFSGFTAGLRLTVTSFINSAMKSRASNAAAIFLIWVIKNDFTAAEEEQVS